MIIGFIGFGRVSQNLVKLISSPDISFLTSAQNRSGRTRELIQKSDVDTADTFEEVAAGSDILISANSPLEAKRVCEKYGRYCRGIYLDLNNISPKTTEDLSKNVDNLVDGAIIGKIDSNNPTLYLSGQRAEDLLFLNDFMDVKIISENIGDASLLKLLRSSYTKTLSALLIEAFEIAENRNLADEFFEILSLTEGSDFQEKSLSRISNTLKSSKRKREELEEIVEYFDGEDLTMVEAAMDKFSRL